MHYLMHDVKEGSLEAYLIKASDKNINNPLANLNIKPYLAIDEDDEQDPNDFILISDIRMYGKGTESFKATVDKVLDEINADKIGILK